jgi:hypothetical protein
MAARDQFEHQVGAPVRVGEISDLVDHEQRRTGAMKQSAPQGGITVARTKIAEQLARAGEQNDVTLD